MSRAYWHLVVNHIPIIFPVLGVILIVTGLISKSEAVKRVAFIILSNPPDRVTFFHSRPCIKPFPN